MPRIHQPIALWFRAIFLIRNSQSISSIALGERLELEQRLAWKLGRTIRRMRADYPDLIQRIVNGPAAPVLAEIQEAGPCDHTQAIR